MIELGYATVLHDTPRQRPFYYRLIEHAFCSAYLAND